MRIFFHTLEKPGPMWEQHPIKSDILPRTGDYVALKSDNYYKVTLVEICYDEHRHYDAEVWLTKADQIASHTQAGEF